MKSFKQFIKVILVVLLSLSLLPGHLAKAQDTHTFSMALNHMPTSLLPSNTGNIDFVSMIRPIYDQLYIELKDHIEYYLAEDVSVSEDGLKYTLKLKDGLLWSDGEAITTEDVMFRIAYENHRKGGSSSYNTVEGQAVEIEIVDDLTMTFSLPKPFAMYNRTIGGIIPLPAHAFDGDVTTVDESGYFNDPKMATSGAFKVDEINEDSLVYSSRDDYYRGKAQVDQIVLKTIGAGTTQQIAFENGEISYMRLSNPNDIAKYSADSEKYTIYSLSESRVNYIQINPYSPQELTLEQRKALTMALNIEEIVNIAYGDAALARPANSFLTPDMSLYNPDNVAPSFNLEEAKKLAEESGLAGKTLTYVFNKDRANMEQIATIVQHQLAQIGVTLQIEPLDSPTFFDRFFAKIFKTGQENTWDLGSNGYDSMYGPTLAQFYNAVNSSVKAWIFSDDLVAQAIAINESINPEERQAMAKELQQKTLEEYWGIPISYTNYVMVAHSNVKGLDQQPIVPEFVDWMTISVE